MAYIFDQQGIFPLILAYGMPWHLKSATISAHMIFISKVPTVTPPVLILDFFSEMTLGDGPKNPRIRVNTLSKLESFHEYMTFQTTASDNYHWSFYIHQFTNSEKSSIKHIT